MEKQVTSIEQSRRLLELGVPAEKASLYWQRFVGDSNRELPDNSGVWILVLEPLRDKRYECVPAFTVVNLLELLPFEIDADCGMCDLQIKKLYADRDYTEWGVYYKNYEGATPFESITSYGIIDALFDMMEKIICYRGFCELNL